MSQHSFGVAMYLAIAKQPLTIREIICTCTFAATIIYTFAATIIYTFAARRLIAGSRNHRHR